MLRRMVGSALVCAMAFALAIGFGSGSPAAPATVTESASAAASVEPASDEAPPAPSGSPADYVTPPTDDPGLLADPALEELVQKAEQSRSLTTPTVLVEVLLSDEQAALAALAAVGATDIAYAGPTMRLARVPVASLVDLENSPGVDFLREPVTVSVAPGDDTAALAQALPAAISGTKGGDLASKVRIASWHTRGYKGVGVKVGVIDLWNKSVYDAARAAGEVPAFAGAICRTNGTKCPTFWRYPSNVGNHGPAVVEAIHDLAPSAKIYIADADTMADYYAVIDYFAAQGVKIISRSLAAKLDGPGNGTGAFADLVDYAVSKGMVWLNAAGNAGARSSEVGGYWRGTWIDTNSNGWIEFQNNDGTTSEFLPGTCAYLMGLRWNDWAGNATDYDIYFFDQFGNEMSRSWIAQTSGVPPLEAFQNRNWCSAGQQYFYAGIYRDAVGNGSAGDVLEILTNGLLYDAVSSPGSAGQPVADSANPGAAAVGAIDPVGGKIIAPYSSQGPLNDGRIKPDFSAASNFTSYSYRNSTGRFNGTSAATPAVAGMAAVLLQRYPTSTPAQLLDRIESTHFGERGEAGPDNVYGLGEIILDQLFTKLPAPKISGTLKEGSTVKVSVGTWSPTPTSFTYQWLRESTPIAGATKSSYKLTSADAGKRIRVTVTPIKLNYLPEKKTSAYSTKVVALKTFTTVGVARVAGTTAVGSTLTALVGTWSPKPTVYKYAWLRDGVAIPGATAKTYTLTGADAGTAISVKVTGGLSGYRSASSTSVARSIPL